MSVFQVIFPLLSVPFAVIEPSTSSVPSGTVSIVRMLVASKLPLFVTFITYVITSPFWIAVCTGASVRESPCT